VLNQQLDQPIGRLIEIVVNQDGVVAVGMVPLPAGADQAAMDRRVVLRAPVPQPLLQLPEPWHVDEDIKRRGGVLADLERPLDLDLQDHANRAVRTLSRGLVQRVAIARALVHDPRVLLLDEPFTGLDRTAAEAFSKLLGQQAAHGRATVIVTHNVEEGTELATDVAFMRAGKFVALAPRAGRTAAEIADAYRAAIGGGARG